MTDWLAQYSAALDARDAREQVHKPYIDAYTKLADRTASNPPQSTTAPAPAPLSPQPSSGKAAARGSSSAQDDTADDTLQRLRADLASTQKARSALQSQADELSATLKDAQQQQRASSAQIAQLTRQKGEAERKLRDREEEIRMKAKLVERAQDEQVALGLQLNMAEERSGRLEKENRELVERWMKRMGEEAEKVNRDSKWE